MSKTERTAAIIIGGLLSLAFCLTSGFLGYVYLSIRQPPPTSTPQQAEPDLPTVTPIESPSTTIPPEPIMTATQPPPVPTPTNTSPAQAEPAATAAPLPTATLEPTATGIPPVSEHDANIPEAATPTPAQ